MVRHSDGSRRCHRRNAATEPTWKVPTSTLITSGGSRRTNIRLSQSPWLRTYWHPNPQARCSGDAAGMETWRGGVGISPYRVPTRGARWWVYTVLYYRALRRHCSLDSMLPGVGASGGPLPEYSVHWISRVHRGLKSGQVDTAQPVDGSGSHGWCGVALLWLHDSVLGVNIASPGGARMSVAPQRSGLPYVCGTTSMPKVRRHVDLRHTLVLGLLGHGSAWVTDKGCVCVVVVCVCAVWPCDVAVRAAVAHIAGHCVSVLAQSAWRAVIVHTDGHHHDRCEPTIVRRWQRAQDAGTRHRLPSVASVWQRVDSRSDGWRRLHTVSGWRVHVQVCVCVDTHTETSACLLQPPPTRHAHTAP